MDDTAVNWRDYSRTTNEIAYQTRLSIISTIADLRTKAIKANRCSDYIEGLDTAILAIRQSLNT
jgi:hypothetical protein